MSADNFSGLILSGICYHCKLKFEYRPMFKKSKYRPKISVGL